MTITANILRELHRIHRQLTDLRFRLEQGPKLISAGEVGSKHFEKELLLAKEIYTKTKVASDDKNLQLKHREDRIAELQTKLNGCSSNREFQTLKDQIAADKQANNVLADEILESLEKLDELQASTEQAAANQKKAAEKLNQTKNGVAEKQQFLEADLERVTEELKQAEASLPAELKADYQRIANGRGEEALAQVEGESCGGCSQILSPQTINELHLSKFVFCKSCGCLLYLPEDRSPRSESD